MELIRQLAGATSQHADTIVAEEEVNDEGRNHDRAELLRQRVAGKIGAKWKGKVFRYNVEGDGAEADVLKQLLEQDERQNSEHPACADSRVAAESFSAGIEHMLQGLSSQFHATMQAFVSANVGDGMDVGHLVGPYVKDLKKIEEKIMEAKGMNDRLCCDAVTLDEMHVTVCSRESLRLCL
jgi:hypothetical protein